MLYLFHINHNRIRFKIKFGFNTKVYGSVHIHNFYRITKNFVLSDFTNFLYLNGSNPIQMHGIKKTEVTEAERDAKTKERERKLQLYVKYRDLIFDKIHKGKKNQGKF